MEMNPAVVEAVLPDDFDLPGLDVPEDPPPFENELPEDPFPDWHLWLSESLSIL